MNAILRDPGMVEMQPSLGHRTTFDVNSTLRIREVKAVQETLLRGASSVTFRESLRREGGAHISGRGPGLEHL